MATKVKGDAIKEGSIPLSALSNEVKGKIENASGANWEAKEGEAGYIENKPFGIGEELIPLDMIVKFSQLQKVSVDWASNVFDVYLHPDPGYDSFISKDINPDADDILNIKEKGAGRVFGYSINNKMIYEEIDHNNFNQTLDGIDTQFDFVLGMKYSQDTIGDTGNYFVVYEGVMYVIHNITYNKIYNDESYMNVYHTEKIHENYLPDTILKTTPQTLSDTDKNQALANLGIDPVVWKYMCNPLILGDYLLEIPLELRDIILGDYSEEFGYTLKPIASSLIKIYNGAGFTSIATFGNGQDYNIDFENNKFIINTHYEIEFV